MDEVRPDDVPRSPTGRVPNWVLDEAQGRAPRDLVPFRAPTHSLVSPAPRRRGGSVLRVVLTLTIVVGLVLLGKAGLPHLPESGSASAQSSRNGPPPGHEEASQPLGAPQPVVIPSGSYRFTMRQDGTSTPVTWSPCRPIHFVVRPDNAPPLGAELLTEGFAQLSLATGLRFVNAGSTDEAPSTDRRGYQKARYGDRWAPVLISWATEDEVPDFGVDLVGEAGPMTVRTPSGDLSYVSGMVSFDAPAMTSMIASGRRSTAQLVVLHELGHLVGLAHVNDSSAVMAPKVGRLDASSYQPGDLAGLSALGSGPCQPDI